MRLIHAAHDTDVTDLYIDGRLAVPRFTYGQYTPYLGLARYSHLIELRRRDDPPDAEPLATVEFEITPENRDQQYWSLLLLNGNNVDVSSLDLLQAQDPVSLGNNTSDRAVSVFNTAGGLMTLVLLPDNIAQTQTGLSRVRVIHAIDGALEISLFAQGVPQPPSAATPEPNAPTPTPSPPVRVVEPVFYGVEANENEIQAGVYGELQFIAGNSTEILTLTNYRFLPGLVHTFVLIGLPSGEPAIQALDIRDFGHGAPRERFYVGTISTADSVAARIRAEPTLASPILTLVDSGSEVEVLGRNRDNTWIKIRFEVEDSAVPREGWISEPLIEVTRLGESIPTVALPVRE